jgi:hypothetical protein
MSKMRVTITTRPGNMSVGDKVRLVKQPDNQFDNEAIQIEINGGVDGYVSAHYRSRKPGTVSAGRLYDRMAESIEGTVVDECIVEVELPEAV